MCEETCEQPNESRFPLAPAIVIIVVSSVLLLMALDGTKLWDDDEGYFAGTAAEMYSSHEWLVPSFNGDLFSHKPPWMYWMMMASFKVFGINAFAARFVTACFGVMSALLAYQLGKRLFNNQVGFLAGLILPTCLMFNTVSRAATPDVFLVFFITLGLFWFARHECRAEGVVRIKWSSWIAIYACFALAVLVKGPIGMLLPMAVIGLFKLCTTARPEVPKASPWIVRLCHPLRPFGPVNFFKTVWWMRPFTATVVLLLVAGPWYLAVGLKTNGLFLQEFFWVHHFHRFSSTMENHGGSLLYYPVSILVGMFPWSFFALPVALEIRSQLLRNNKQRRPVIFLGCWVLVIVGLFSCSGTKLSNYVLPAYPPLAILVGLYFSSLPDITPKQAWKFFTLRLCALVMLLVGGPIALGVPLLTTMKVNGQLLLDRADLASSVGSEVRLLGLLGIPILIAGFTVFRLSRGVNIRPLKQQYGCNSIFLVTFLMAFSFLGLAWTVFAPRLAELQAAQKTGEQLAQLSDDNPNVKVLAYSYFYPSMVFYARRTIMKTELLNDAIQFEETSNGGFIVTNETGYQQLKQSIEGLDVVFRMEDFPKAGLIYILKKIPGTQSATTASQ